MDQVQWHDPLPASNATDLAVMEEVATLNSPARHLLLTVTVL
jgi:hypothetical protein